MAWVGRRRSPALAAAGCFAVAVRACGASRLDETQACVVKELPAPARAAPARPPQPPAPARADPELAPAAGPRAAEPARAAEAAAAAPGGRPPSLATAARPARWSA